MSKKGCGAVLLGLVVSYLALSLAMPPVSALAYDGGAEFGFRIGANFSGCSGLGTFFDPSGWGEDLPKAAKGYREGLVLGMFWSYPISGNLFIQPEGLYSMEGCSRNYDVTLSYPDGDYDLDAHAALNTTVEMEYLEIPLLLKYVIGNPAASAPFILAGPAIGFRSDAKMTVDATYSAAIYRQGYYYSQDSFGTSYHYDMEDYTKETNLTLIFGAGYSLRGDRISLQAEARYALGLTGLLSKAGRQAVGSPDQIIYLEDGKTRTIAFTVGLTF